MEDMSNLLDHVIFSKAALEWLCLCNQNGQKDILLLMLLMLFIKAISV